jgi:transposase
MDRRCCPLLHIIEDLIADRRHLDQRIEDVSLQIEALAEADAGCERLMTVPGSGPIISSATVARDRYRRRVRQGARLQRLARPVPKQISTGDRTIRGNISKRGNKYLRTLLVQADQALRAALAGPALTASARAGLGPAIDRRRAADQISATASRWPRSRLSPTADSALRAQHGC